MRLSLKIYLYRLAHVGDMCITNVQIRKVILPLACINIPFFGVTVINTNRVTGNDSGFFLFVEHFGFPGCVTATNITT